MRKGSKKPKARLRLMIRVGGQEYPAEVYRDGPIGGAVDFAIMRAGLTPDQWPSEVRDMSGRVMAVWLSAAELGLTDGSVVYVDLPHALLASQESK